MYLWGAVVLPSLEVDQAGVVGRPPLCRRRAWTHPLHRRYVIRTHRRALRVAQRLIESAPARKTVPAAIDEGNATCFMHSLPEHRPTLFDHCCFPRARVLGLPRKYRVDEQRPESRFVAVVVDVVEIDPRGRHRVEGAHLVQIESLDPKLVSDGTRMQIRVIHLFHHDTATE